MKNKKLLIVLILGLAIVCVAARTLIDLAHDVTGTLPYTHGGSGQVTAPDDDVLVGNGTGWDLKALPNCADSGGGHLNYSTSTNAWSCGTSTSGVLPGTSASDYF